ncbi:hypothetical protein F7725_020845 [Dissostichus mawsoni]|uniref:Uncharacterized protein n=1 Tax=Dissostichus mawsoni TaxID=36200 RepID=A0A7J5YH35_DISMA|nr:hypothetical protein F7725_020845 [Dissostichus mawsoni]
MIIKLHLLYNKFSSAVTDQHTQKQPQTHMTWISECAWQTAEEELKGITGDKMWRVDQKEGGGDDILSQTHNMLFLHYMFCTLTPHCDYFVSSSLFSLR